MLQNLLPAMMLACGLLVAPTTFGKDPEPAKAGDAAKNGERADKPHKDDEINLPPFPADKTVHQACRSMVTSSSTTQPSGRCRSWTRKARPLPASCLRPTPWPVRNRPVTFAVNGGPGASSVYLNLGAIGPKRLQFGAEGNSPSDPATLIDNAGTWLDFTDLVFIDPVGTGFSFAQVKEDEAKKHFYNPKADVEYLSRIIFDWLVKNERLTARKYLVGESYGGFRVPRMTHYLQTRLGVAMNGRFLSRPIWIRAPPTMATCRHCRGC